MEMEIPLASIRGAPEKAGRTRGRAKSSGFAPLGITAESLGMS